MTETDKCFPNISFLSLFFFLFFMVQKYLISAMSVQKNTQPVAHPLKAKEPTEKLVEILFTLEMKRKN